MVTVLFGEFGNLAKNNGSKMNTKCYIENFLNFILNGYLVNLLMKIDRKSYTQ